VTGRQGRRRKQLVDDLREKRGYCKPKEEALDGTLQRTRFRRRYGPLISHTTVKKRKHKGKNIRDGKTRKKT